MTNLIDCKLKNQNSSFFFRRKNKKQLKDDEQERQQENLEKKTLVTCPKTVLDIIRMIRSNEKIGFLLKDIVQDLPALMDAQPRLTPMRIRDILTSLLISVGTSGHRGVEIRRMTTTEWEKRCVLFTYQILQFLFCG